MTKKLTSMPHFFSSSSRRSGENGSSLTWCVWWLEWAEAKAGNKNSNAGDVNSMVNWRSEKEEKMKKEGHNL